MQEITKNEELKNPRNKKLESQDKKIHSQRIRGLKNKKINKTSIKV